MQGYEKKIFFQLSNLSQPVFLLENPTHWGLANGVCPIFAKPVLDIFAVCSLQSWPKYMRQTLVLV